MLKPRPPFTINTPISSAFGRNGGRVAWFGLDLGHQQFEGVSWRSNQLSPTVKETQKRYSYLNFDMSHNSWNRSYWGDTLDKYSCSLNFKDLHRVFHIAGTCCYGHILVFVTGTTAKRLPKCSCTTLKMMKKTKSNQKAIILVLTCCTPSQQGSCRSQPGYGRQSSVSDTERPESRAPQTSHKSHSTLKEFSVKEIHWVHLDTFDGVPGL